MDKARVATEVGPGEEQLLLPASIRPLRKSPACLSLPFGPALAGGGEEEVEVEAEVGRVRTGTGTAKAEPCVALVGEPVAGAHHGGRLVRRANAAAVLEEGGGTLGLGVVMVIGVKAASG